MEVDKGASIPTVHVLLLKIKPFVNYILDNTVNIKGVIVCKIIISFVSVMEVVDDVHM